MATERVTPPVPATLRLRVVETARSAFSTRAAAVSARVVLVRSGILLQRLHVYDFGTLLSNSC